MKKVVNSILLLLIVLVQYGIWAGQSSLPRYFELQKQVTEQQQENQRSNARNKILFAEIEDLRHGHEAIEERARNELGMIREGEVFYRVVDQ